jgi:hypothetical protein
VVTESASNADGRNKAIKCNLRRADVRTPNDSGSVCKMGVCAQERVE